VSIRPGLSVSTQKRAVPGSQSSGTRNRCGGGGRGGGHLVKIQGGGRGDRSEARGAHAWSGRRLPLELLRPDTAIIRVKDQLSSPGAAHLALHQPNAVHLQEVGDCMDIAIT
jgi:hypothetical protein